MSSPDDTRPNWSWLKCRGEMGERIQELDWSKTSLGHPDTWSSALRMMIGFLLPNRFPLLLWWGPEYVSIYNDSYRSVLGTKHPGALGQRVQDCWQEVWHILKPLIDTPFQGGPATWNDDICLELNRHGFVEETHFTIAYSPVPDESVVGGIGGVLATVHEITSKVFADRRVMILRDLSSCTLNAESADDVCRLAAKTLAEYPRDLPFGLFYLLDPLSQTRRLVSEFGCEPPESVLSDSERLQKWSSLAWPFSETLATSSPYIVKNLEQIFAAGVPRGPWSTPPQQAFILPIRSASASECVGLLVAGMSSCILFDEAYRAFYELMTEQISASIARARAFEEEKKRTEALQEIDRAKTQFFSNISHEFRTPLTLILGPIEDLLQCDDSHIAPALKGQIEIARRNALRLLKMVNTLLDYSRIEAGRIRVSFQETDIARYTSELASHFRSACERAGIQLLINCMPAPVGSQAVFIDPEMWENIVLNLLSNAFKYTHEGRIEVCLIWTQTHVQMEIRDTGVGIPSEELPRIFERFYRIKEARGRTHEGTGIGLALVFELVKLHSGKISVSSKLHEGSVFTVSIPLGTAHIDPALLRRAASETESQVPKPIVEEALSWLKENKENLQVASDQSYRKQDGTLPSDDTKPRPLIIWADDNPDMRSYVQRLLSGMYDVDAVADGEHVLQRIPYWQQHGRTPDLILTDVMMPHMDGFELLAHIRATPAWAKIPVILLSARAGEKARIEGLTAGADDYLVKPFTAREMLARIEGQIKMAAVRRDAAVCLAREEQRCRALIEASCDVVYRTSADWSTMEYLEGRGFLADTTEPCSDWMQRYVHPNDQLLVKKTIQECLASKQVFDLEHQVLRVDGSSGWTHSRAVPIFDAQAEIGNWLGMASDISARKEAEALLEQDHLALQRLQALSIIAFQKGEMQKTLLEVVDAAIVVSGADFGNIQLFEENQGHLHIVAQRGLSLDWVHFWNTNGQDQGACVEARRLRERTVIPDIEQSPQFIGTAALAVHREAGIRAMQSTPLVNRFGELLGIFSTYYKVPHHPDERVCHLLDLLARQAADIIDEAQKEQALRLSEERYRNLAEQIADGIFVADSQGYIVDANQAGCQMLGYQLRELKALTLKDLLVQTELGKHPRLRAKVEANWQGPGTWLFRRKNGSTFWGQLVGRRQDDGRILGVLRDITDLLRHEEVELANQAKTKFLATISHEIRTPLGVILGYAEMLGQTQTSDADREEYAHTIKRNGEHLLHLINDILDVSKVESGVMALEAQTVNLSELMGEICTQFDIQARSRGIQLIVKISSKIPVTITTDETRVKQVLVNIIGNALKFTEKGQVLIDISYRSLPSLAHPELVFLIQDTGCGIAVESQQKIFQPFTQAEAYITRRYGGTGLGLSLARNIAQILGGDVRLVWSELGKGSAFELTIDPGEVQDYMLVDQLILRKTLPSTKDQSRLDGVRVLLVDDFEDNRLLYTHLLSKLGAHVELAADGNEAVTKAMNTPYDIILMDVQMPIMNGYEATSILRAQGYEKPVIALTAHAMKGELERCMNAGCSGYLSKPISTHDLIQCIVEHRPSSITPAEDPSPASSSNQATESEEDLGALHSTIPSDHPMYEVVKELAGRLPTHMTKAQDYLSLGNWSDLKVLSHQLKGLGGSIGFPTISELAAELESELKDAKPDSSQVRSLVLGLDAVVKRIRV